MKKLFILALIVGAGVLMFATCPDRKDHQEAIKAAVADYLEEEISILPAGVEDVVNSVGIPIAGTVLDVVMKNKLKVNNYYLFSIGEVTHKGENKKVSFGILGHVFTLDKDDVRDIVNKNI